MDLHADHPSQSSLGKRKRMAFQETISIAEGPSRQYVIGRSSVFASTMTDAYTRSSRPKPSFAVLPPQTPSPVNQSPSATQITKEVEHFMSISSLSKRDLSPARKHRRIIRSPKSSRKPLQESGGSIQNSSNTDTKQDKPNLAPCHICWRAPRLKKDLDGYTDCRRCRKRTCYICMRQCEVIDCRSGKICGSCCVELGVEGDVFCHDCLGNPEDHAMEE
jgi:hypothetical protein